MLEILKQHVPFDQRLTSLWIFEIFASNTEKTQKMNSFLDYS